MVAVTRYGNESKQQHEQEAEADEADQGFEQKADQPAHSSASSGGMASAQSASLPQTPRHAYLSPRPRMAAREGLCARSYSGWPLRPMALTLASTPATADPATVKQAVAADYDSHLEELFKHFHANPELSFLEDRNRQADGGRIAGCRARRDRGRGRHGRRRDGTQRRGPLILLRADMDGLPMRKRPARLCLDRDAGGTGWEGISGHARLRPRCAHYFDGRHRTAPDGDERRVVGKP